METKPKLASDGKPAIAESLFTLITLNQIEDIKNLSKRVGVTVTKVSRELFDCEYDYLSQSGAVDVIEHLRRLEVENLR